MRDVIVVKWGGGLITDKSKLCTPEKEVIEQLALTVRDCIDQGLKVIVVHGAGSYGHLRAKHWKLNLGYHAGEKFLEQDGCSDQYQAVELVRKEMLDLNQHVRESLEAIGVRTQIHPPHQWVKGTGADFNGDLKRFHSRDQTTVEITFGDVVEVESEKQFGILSGDDLVARLSIELPNVRRLVFAIGGVDGILRVPPHLARESDLIQIWSSKIQFEGFHDTEIDVTGGIGLKAARGALVASKGIDVIMVNGDYPSRVYDAMMGNEVRGTKIIK